MQIYVYCKVISILALSLNKRQTVMKSEKPKKCRMQIVTNALLLTSILSFYGCGDILNTKQTDMQSENIIRDLSTVQPATTAALPDIYLAEPTILEDKDGVKLFYFTRFHTVEKFSGLLKEQFGYPVSQNPATNQLIIKCPARENAQKVLEFLKQVDVPPIQVRIDCLVSEVYADRTLDWETTLQIQNLFGEDVVMGGSARAFGKDVQELVNEGSILPAFPGASLREVARARMGLKIGYSNKDLLAMVDILESRGYLKVLMNPSLEVINGRKARISSKETVPVPKEVSQGGKEFLLLPYTVTEYKDVEDSLEITPHAFADGSIGLEISVVIGSKNIPEGVKQIPILTKREIDIDENRIRPGESLIIGGLKKSTEHSVVRGVPLLKDIPLLGVLFSSKDYEEQANEIIFIVTPSISKGGIPSDKMLQQLDERSRLPNVPALPGDNSLQNQPKQSKKTDDFGWLKKYTGSKPDQ